MSYPHPPNSEAEAGHQAQTDYATGVRAPSPVVSPSVSTHVVAGVSPVASPAEVPGQQADTVAGSVSAAVANAQARYASHQADTLGGAGRDIGTQLNLPQVPDNAVPPASTDGYPWSGDEPVPAA
jgi:hypothetical protein